MADNSRLFVFGGGDGSRRYNNVYILDIGQSQANTGKAQDTLRLFDAGPVPFTRTSFSCCASSHVLAGMVLRSLLEPPTRVQKVPVVRRPMPGRVAEAKKGEARDGNATLN